MALGQHKRAVGVFPNRRAAELALRELRDSRFPMDRVSVITRDGDRHDEIAGAEVRDDVRGDRHDNKADEGATTGAVAGGALGGLTGLLVGLGTLAIPGIGPIMLAGATATAIATTLAGGAIGAVAGSLVGALIGLGIPEERARAYNDRVSRGDYLIMVEGTDEEIRRAHAILHHHGIEDWGVYDLPAGERRDDDRDRAHYATPGTSHPNLGRRHRAVGVFPHRRDVEAALYELRQAGFPMDRISVVGKNADRDDRIAGVEMKNSATGNKADEGAAAGAASGAALGGLGGLLVGLGALAIPGIGPVLAGGALATALATTAAGGAIGAAAGGLTGALVGLGIPEERARFYNDRVTHGDYLVMVDGDDDELRRAQAILSRHGIREWGVYDTSDIAPGQDRDRTPDADRYRREHGTPGSPHHTLVGYKRAVGVFPHRRDAEAAIRELHNAGFPMNQISLVGKDTPQESHVGSANVTDRTQVDEGAKAGAAGGAALGGLGGLLVGLGALAIPGIGPVLAGGALATALATTAAGGAIGAAAGGLTGALVGLGIPDNRARFYNDRVNRGDYLVMVDGTEDEIRRAEAILRRHSIQDWDIFDAPDRDRHDRDYVGTSSSRTVGTAVSHPSYADSTPNVTIIDRREQIL